MGAAADAAAGDGAAATGAFLTSTGFDAALGGEATGLAVATLVVTTSGFLMILALVGAAARALALPTFAFALLLAFGAEVLAAGFLVDFVTDAPERAFLAAAFAGFRLISFVDFALLLDLAGDELLFFLRAAIFVHSNTVSLTCLLCGVSQFFFSEERG